MIVDRVDAETEGLAAGDGETDRPEESIAISQLGKGRATHIPGHFGQYRVQRTVGKVEGDLPGTRSRNQESRRAGVTAAVVAAGDDERSVGHENGEAIGIHVCEDELTGIVGPDEGRVERHGGRRQQREDQA